MEEANSTPSPERQLLIDQVIDTVIEGHMDTCNYTSPKVAAGMATFQENMRMGKMVRKPYVGQNPISHTHEWPSYI